MTRCVTMLCFKIIYLLLLLLSLSTATKIEIDMPQIQDSKKLSDYLMQNYSKHILPAKKLPFHVTVMLTYSTLGEIDEIEEMLSCVFWLEYKWVDESIKWDVKDNGILLLTFGWNDVWTPILRVANPHAGIAKSQNADRSYDTVVYTHNGEAYLIELMLTRTTCDLDMTYYPFDLQTCSINFFIIGHTKYLFRIKAFIKDNHILEEKSHGSWILLNRTISAGDGMITINLMFKRQPLFLLINIFLPIIVLALLTPIVFILPKKSGERVGYSITMLLAISVYMTIVSEHLPHNSQPMPLISIMIFVCYVFDALIVFIVIMNTKIYAMKNSWQLPTYLKRFVFFTRKILAVFSCVNVHDKLEDDTSEKQEEYFGSETLIGKENEIEHPKDLKYLNIKHDVTWQDLSHTIDKWCFVISYICKVLLPVIFFSVCKAKSW